ncbi:MAG: DUF4442 domain-containing protein [Flavisolibacter sp.]
MSVDQAVSTRSAGFFSLIRNPLKFRLFMWQKLPAAYFSGLKLSVADEQKAEVTIPYKWFTRNPFRSTYFACLSMAAEMSTGILAMAHVYKRQPKISMLVVATEGKFYKKAIAKTRFVCKEGQRIRETIQRAVDSGESQTIRVLSSGFNEAGELIAEFWITWSFKIKAV